MTQQKRPEWIQKAAEAVTAFYHHEQDGAERAKERVQASEAKLKTDVHAAEAKAADAREKVANIIHQHFQAHK